ncbi:MAG: recombinase family protein [Planctomycetaceae bacterium]|nr:recombinase family protein [Planctomycetaceae bacterium]
MSLDLQAETEHSVRIVLIGRISTTHQNIENIEASFIAPMRVIENEYPGRKSIRKLGEQASGNLADRRTMRELEDLIEARMVDVVVAEDLGRIYRNPRLHYTFIQDAVDREIRVICVNDGLDTAKENWEAILASASVSHGTVIPQTRNRVKRTAENSFNQGGMVLKVKYGYRKLSKEEARSGQFGPVGLRIAKNPDCTPIIAEMVDWAIAGESYQLIAERLNDRQISPGPYVTKQLWTGRLVDEFLHDPILYGKRRFRRTLSKMVFATGRSRRLKNPNSPLQQTYPGLAHISREKFEELHLALESRRIPAGRPTKPKGQRGPRNITLFPGQLITCGICGGRMYRLDGCLKCCNVIPKGPRTCWNHVQVPTELTIRKVLEKLVSSFDQFPSFRQSFADAVWESYQSQKNKRDRTQNSMESVLNELNRQKQNLLKAIRTGGNLPALVDELKQIESDIEVKSQQFSPKVDDCDLHNLVREEIEDRLLEVLIDLAEHSHEFAALMQRLVTRFNIIPMQGLSSQQVHPRALITLDFSSFLKEASLEGNGYRMEFELDLFIPPLYIVRRSECVRLSVENPKLSYKQIGQSLGINYMIVKRAMDYERQRVESGWQEDYRPLKSCPEKASRWRDFKKNPKVSGEENSDAETDLK